MHVRGYETVLQCHVFLKQRVREEREQKRSQLDDRHGYLLSLVALATGLDQSEVEDSIVDGQQVRFMFCTIVLELGRVGKRNVSNLVSFLSPQLLASR